MIRVVTVSGLAYTGATSLGQAVARDLGWDFINVGNRMRDLCERRGLIVATIPLEVHRTVDTQVQTEIRDLQRVVIEGRYTGLFARAYADVLRVLVEAELSRRAGRCLEREPGIQSLREAEAYVQHRDLREQRNAMVLHGTDDFVNPAFFDLILRDIDTQNFDAAVQAVLQKVRGDG